MKIDKKTYFSQKIILVNKNREMLIIKRGKTAPSRPGYWDLPGGEVEYGENLSNGIIRETKEETGLEIKTPSLLDVCAKFNDKKEYWVTICYSFQVIDTNVKLTFEHEAFRWIKPQEFCKLKASPKNKKFVETFLQRK